MPRDCTQSAWPYAMTPWLSSSMGGAPGSQPGTSPQAVAMSEPKAKVRATGLEVEARAASMDWVNVRRVGALMAGVL